MYGLDSIVQSKVFFGEWLGMSRIFCLCLHFSWEIISLDSPVGLPFVALHGCLYGKTQVLVVCIYFSCQELVEQRWMWDFLSLKQLPVFPALTLDLKGSMWEPFLYLRNNPALKWFTVYQEVAQKLWVRGRASFSSVVQEFDSNILLIYVFDNGLICFSSWKYII